MKPDTAIDYLMNPRAGREDDSSRDEEADFAGAGSVIHTNGVAVLSFAAHHG
jgi:hypothetical protein